MLIGSNRLLEVQAPTSKGLKLSYVIVDITYILYNIYGIYEYSTNYDEIMGKYSEDKLLTVIFPMFAALGLAMILRLLIFLFIFVWIPWRVHVRQGEKFNSFTHKNASYPCLKFKDYLK